MRWYFRNLFFCGLVEFSHFQQVHDVSILTANSSSIRRRIYEMGQELVLEKAEEPEIKLPTSTGSLKNQESSRKTSISALLTMPKPFVDQYCVDHHEVWKILKEMGIPDHLTCLLRNLYAGRKQQLELDMEQQTGSK